MPVRQDANFTRMDYTVGNCIPDSKASTPVDDAGFRTGRTGPRVIADDCSGAVSLHVNGTIIEGQMVVGDEGLAARAIVDPHMPRALPIRRRPQSAPVVATKVSTSWSI
jgi:hypothetical protein